MTQKTISLIVGIVILFIVAQANATATGNGYPPQQPLIVSRPILLETTPQPQFETPPVPILPPAGKDHCRLVTAFPWPHREAYATCWGESSGRPETINYRDKHGAWGSGPCEGSLGLFQIACAWVGVLPVNDESHLLHARTNVWVAYRLWERSGGSFHHWSAYKFKSSQYQKGLERF